MDSFALHLSERQHQRPGELADGRRGINAEVDGCDRAASIRDPLNERQSIANAETTQTVELRYDNALRLSSLDPGE